jgi:hypothetical protein
MTAAPGLPFGSAYCIPCIGHSVCSARRVLSLKSTVNTTACVYVCRMYAGIGLTDRVSACTWLVTCGRHVRRILHHLSPLCSARLQSPLWPLDVQQYNGFLALLSLNPSVQPARRPVIRVTSSSRRYMNASRNPRICPQTDTPPWYAPLAGTGLGFSPRRGKPVDLFLGRHPCPVALIRLQ